MNEHLSHDEIPYIPMSMKVDLVIHLLAVAYLDNVTLSDTDYLVINQYMNEIKQRIKELENNEYRNHLGRTASVKRASEQTASK